MGPSTNAPDFQQLFQAAPGCYLVLSPEFTILGATDAYLSATLTRREQVVGRHLFEVFPDNPEDPTADGVARLRASLERVLSTRAPDEMAIQKYDIQRPPEQGGGFEVRYWSPVNRPVLDAAGELRWILHCVEDVTEKVRLRATARSYGERLEGAVENTEGALVLFDEEGQVALCNSAFRRLVGAESTGALVGKTRAAVLEAWLPRLLFRTPEERQRFCEPEAHAERKHFALDVRTVEGDSLRVQCRWLPDGSRVETVWDLTEDARREVELREARSVADAANAAKSEFLSSMSHELRTPLNAILGFSHLALRDNREPLPERQRSRLETISKSGTHLLRLINEILDLSGIEAGRITLSLEPVSVPETLDALRTTLGPAAEVAGLELSVGPLPSPLPMVLADRTRLLQILMNLGSNAVKYNRRGGWVHFYLSASPERVRVTVADSGPGIPLDKQKKLFEPFQRLGQEAGTIEGTGIGLTITRRLAAAMGGDVGFRSVPGEGSEFWLELPAHHAPEKKAESTAEQAPSILHRDRRGLVLYVEDNPSNVAVMEDLLDGFEGIELVLAPTAEQGLDLARFLLPDVVLMDLNLPGMSGFEALRELRSSPRTRSIPVIALTAAATERDRRKGLELGFHRYLTKPIVAEELETELESILRTPRSS